MMCIEDNDGAITMAAVNRLSKERLRQW